MQKDTGLVIKSTGSWYTVITDNNTQVQCRIKGKIRLKGIKSTNPITVGDKVDLEINDDKIGVITAIKERKNYILRKSTNLSKRSHVIAANLDQAVLIVTVKYPETTYTFIDRFLATAEAYNVPSVLVFNKLDRLADDDLDKLAEMQETYESIGYPCYTISVKKEINLDTIKSLLAEKVSLVSGNSGVGKSSLINYMNPNVNLKVSEISEYHKTGKHTTTFSEMIQMPNGGWIIDTPGVKSFGTVDFKKEEVYHFFPELFKGAEHCRFYNCLHLEEPGCAVHEAIRTGEIAATRYKSYLSILEDEFDTKFRV